MILSDVFCNWAANAAADTFHACKAFALRRALNWLNGKRFPPSGVARTFVVENLNLVSCHMLALIDVVTMSTGPPDPRLDREENRREVNETRRTCVWEGWGEEGARSTRHSQVKGSKGVIGSTKNKYQSGDGSGGRWALPYQESFFISCEWEWKISVTLKYFFFFRTKTVQNSSVLFSESESAPDRAKKKKSLNLVENCIQTYLAGVWWRGRWYASRSRC